MPNLAAFLRTVAVGRPRRLAIVFSECDAAASLISSRSSLNGHTPFFCLPTLAIIYPSPSAAMIVGVDRFAEPLHRELDIVRLQMAPALDLGLELVLRVTLEVFRGEFLSGLA